MALQMVIPISLCLVDIFNSGLLDLYLSRYSCYCFLALFYSFHVVVHCNFVITTFLIEQFPLEIIFVLLVFSTTTTTTTIFSDRSDFQL